MQPAFVSAAKIAATLTPALRATDGVITITGIGDHLRPEWPITITGMRSVTRVLGTVEGLKRFVQMHQSPYHGLNFCQGTIAEMFDDPAREIFEVIRWF